MGYCFIDGFLGRDALWPLARSSLGCWTVETELQVAWGYRDIHSLVGNPLTYVQGLGRGWHVDATETDSSSMTNVRPRYSMPTSGRRIELPL